MNPTVSRHMKALRFLPRVCFRGRAGDGGVKGL